MLLMIDYKGPSQVMMKLLLLVTDAKKKKKKSDGSNHRYAEYAGAGELVEAGMCCNQ